MKEYKSIIKHYESCFEKHGDSHLGMDWPNAEDVLTRFQIMLDSVRENNEQVSILYLMARQIYQVGLVLNNTQKYLLNKN